MRNPLIIRRLLVPLSSLPLPLVRVSPTPLRRCLVTLPLTVIRRVGGTVPSRLLATFTLRRTSLCKCRLGAPSTQLPKLVTVVSLADPSPLLLGIEVRNVMWAPVKVLLMPLPTASVVSIRRAVDASLEDRVPASLRPTRVTAPRVPRTKLSHSVSVVVAAGLTLACRARRTTEVPRVSINTTNSSQATVADRAGVTSALLSKCWPHVVT